MSYVWGKERVCVNWGESKIEKDLLALEVIDYPMELVSDDCELYMLLFSEEEPNGEWWFVVETSPQVVIPYLKGELSVRDIFDRGKVYLTFRSYDEYDELSELKPLEEMMKQGFVKEEELPTYKAKMSVDEDFFKELEVKV